MKDIKISFKNFWSGFDYKQCPFYVILCKHYNVQVVNEITNDVDLLFTGVFSEEDIKQYIGSIKIITVSYENTYPNFNAYDYSIGYYNIGIDRNIRLPLFWYYDFVAKHKLFGERKLLINEPNLSNEIFEQKDNSIGMVISNTFRDGMEYLYPLLENFDFKSGGRFYNNVSLGPDYNDKIELFETCKFGIAFENADNEDYVTEKIYDCYVANTIPIYFGPKNIDNDFNPESFIDVKKYKTSSELIEHIQYLMHNKEAYMDMLNKKRITNHINYTARCEEFLINIIENGKIYNHIYGGIDWFGYGSLYRNNKI